MFDVMKNKVTLEHAELDDKCKLDRGKQRTTIKFKHDPKS